MRNDVVFSDSHVTALLVAFAGSTVAESVILSFVRRGFGGVPLLPAISIDETSTGLTVTEQVARRLEPSVVAAVTVAEPMPVRVTKPLVTVATDALEVVQVTAREVTLSGRMAARRVVVSPMMPLKESAERVIEEARVGLTTTIQVAVRLEPSVVAAVIVAEPRPVRVMKPSETVATAGLEVVQVTVWLVVLAGTQVAVSVVVSPTMPEKRPRERVRPEAMTGLTVTWQVSERLEPSVVVAVMVAEPTLRAVI
jgi:hypothetical protein